MRRGWVVAALSVALGCKAKPADEADGGVAPIATTTLARPETATRRHDLIENLSQCEIRHRGVLFDLGSPLVEGLEGWRLASGSATTNVEQEGATWARVVSKSVSYRFVLDEPQQVFLAARIKGLSNKSASLTLDGKSAGLLSFTRGASKMASTSVLSSPLSPGLHTLGLRFSGNSRDGADPFAEIDWLRVGFPDDDPSSFAAPTLADVLQNRAALGGEPRRSIALRAPSLVRCWLGVLPGARFRTSVGVQGTGEAEVEIRVAQEGQPAEILKSQKALGGEKGLWTDLELPLQAHEGKVVRLELAAVSAPRGVRVLFGEPAVVGREARIDPIAKARAVILVVISSVNPARLPPWAPERPLPTFDALAREGVLFERYRAPSTAVNAVMASLLTGLHPRQHGVEDSYARLHASLPTLATIARDASVRTAMFTAHPQTFEAFGFARGWDKFVSHSPVSPALGTRPIEDLIGWLAEHGKKAEKGLLAVAHTRGIHPPFDMTPGDFAQLPPHPDREYAGPLDPRRAGQVLEKFRAKKRGSQLKWSENDALRLSAMIDNALVQTDRSLSNLIDALRKAGLWNDTLLIVTSDVAGATDPNTLPFGDPLEMSEDALWAPLYVHFPGGAHAGERCQAPTTAADVALTALSALGLDAAAPGGAELFSLVERGVLPAERPLFATFGERTSARWGEVRLLAREGAPPQVCDLASDPKCEREQRDAWPLLTQAMWRLAYQHEARATSLRPRREPAALDANTAAALAVWGRLF